MRRCCAEALSRTRRLSGRPTTSRCVRGSKTGTYVGGEFLPPALLCRVRNFAQQGSSKVGPLRTHCIAVAAPARP